MINKGLMMRGEAAVQEKSLRMFQKARIMEIRKQLENLHLERKQAQDSKETLYERYAAGGMTPEEYRREADGLDRQMALAGSQIHDSEEELLRLEEECERLEEDMKQVIRFSHMEELTQELVDVFIEKIYVYKDKRAEIKWKFREFSGNAECRGLYGGENVDGK